MIKILQVEFAEKLAEKKEAYAELKKVRDELRALTSWCWFDSVRDDPRYLALYEKAKQMAE